MEFLYHKQRGVNPRILLSPQDIWDNLVQNEEQNHDGRTLTDAYNWMRNHGCVLEESWPYRGVLGPPPQNRQVHFSITRCTWVPFRKMKGHLMDEGPIAVPVKWIDGMRKFRGDGIYNGPTQASAFVNTATNHVGDHALLVIGFGSERTVEGKLVEYWIVQNSHGEGWGMDGYAKFNMDIMCGNERLIYGGYAPVLIS